MPGGGKKIWVLVSLAAICFAISFGLRQTSALDHRKAVTQYRHDVWEDKDGLPQNTVLALAQTRDGYLWIGTEVGLVRFDGVRFTVFDRKNTPEIRSNYVATLYESRDGSLWIGTRGGGLVKFKDGKFSSGTADNALTNGFVRAITEDARGGLWIGTSDGLSCLRDGRLTTYTRRDGLPINMIRALYEDRAGNLWIATGTVLTRRTDGEFFIHGMEGEAFGHVVRTIREDRQGTLWVGTEGGGLYRTGHGKSRTFTTKDGLSSNYVRTLLEDVDGNLWIGTDGGGLNRFDVEGGFSLHTVREGLTSDTIRALCEDTEGNLWVGTEGGGLNRFGDGKFTTYTIKEGLPSNFVRAVRQDRSGSVWVGTEGGGLTRWINGKFVLQPWVSANSVTAIYEDAEGTLWIGTEGDGLCRFRDNKVTTYTADNGLSHNTVWAIHEDQAGTLWIGTGSGLDRMKDGKITPYTAEGKLFSKSVRTFHQGRDGSLWLGVLSDGLVRLKDGRLTEYDTGVMSNLSVSAIREDAEGVLWVATDAGLVRFEGEQATVFTTREGLFNDTLFQIIEDEDNRLWMSSKKGIFHVGRKELNNVAAGRVAAVTSVSYTTSDGMKSSECAGGAQPAGWRTRDGRLWFSTVRGLAVIDPRAIRRNHVPPPVYIEHIVVGNTPLVTSRLKENFELLPTSNDLTIRYTGLSFVAPEAVRFKYKLEGLEEEWVDAGSRREAFYTNLLPGNYTFRVIATNNDSVWNESGASLSFYIQPHFYQTPWFYGLCAACVALFGYAVHRRHVWQVERRMKHEFAVVSAERNRVARDLHDTLLQGMTGVTFQMAALAEEIAKEPQTAKTHLHQIISQMGDTLKEARHAVRDLRAPALKRSDLATALTNSAHQLTVGTQAQAHVNVNGVSSSLPPEVETNVLRIAQEAIINAVKHADAEHIEVQLNFADQQVGLRVQDDGRGFDERSGANPNGEHIGLLAMRERAEKIGGQLSLRSTLCHGTEVTVTVPLKS